MKPFITLLVLLSFCFNTTAQHLKGKVLDAETNLPIENVNVYWSNQDDGTFTDDHGEFDLKLRKRIRQDDLIYFTHVSYAAQKLSFKDLKAQNFTIKLKIDTTQLDAVNLLSRRRLRRQLKYETLPSMKKGTYAFGSAFAAGKIYVFGGDISNETNGVKKTIQNNPNLDVASNFDPGFGFQELLRRINMAYMNSYEGYNSYLQIYNIDRSNWDWKKTELPKRAYHDMIYDKNNNEIYVLGGKRLSMHRKFEYLTNEIEVFDLKNDTVLTDKTNPHQAVNFASFIKDDNIILMGGSIKQKRNGKKVYTDKTHLFDTGTGLWYELGNMPEAKETSGILLGNTIYLIGGFNGESLSGIETYDLNDGKWTRMGELFEPVSRPGIASDADHIYIYYPGNLAVYNIRTGLINEYAINFHVNEPEMFLHNRRLYLLGGYDENDYEKEPSSRMISIDLNELKYTSVKRSKKVGSSI